MRVEIKFDETTLPKDGQKVRYRNIETGKWYLGEYSAEDQSFSEIDGDNWECANMVDFWETA